MSSKELIKYLKNSISEKGNYCYSLPIETTKATIKHIKEKDKEIERLNNIINELEKWLDKKEKLTFNSWNKGIHEVQRKLQELKGVDKE